MTIKRLLGSAPNQVSTNKNLGDLAFQDIDGLAVTSATVNGNCTQNQTTVQSSTVTNQITGNTNVQGTPTWRTIVRHISVVTTGTQLIIPFISQGSLNQSTIIRLTGTSAIFNGSSPLRGFSAYISVTHLTSVSATSWDLGGNVASVTTSGMNVIVTFTTSYVSATANGLFVCLEYLCGNPAVAIDTANIVMN
jgi:hypothetical protein